MKQTKPPKRKGGSSGQSSSLKLKTLFAKYSILRLVQAPFLAVFWFLEQRISKLQDKLANSGLA